MFNFAGKGVQFQTETLFNLSGQTVQFDLAYSSYLTVALLSVKIILG
ncbi:radical SAM protein [Desulfitobacterium sp. AusDCA]